MMNHSLIFGSGLSSYKDFDGLRQVCQVALEHGIVCFDTAPSYRTEALLSKVVIQCAKELGLQRTDYKIQTKIDPIHMYNGQVESYFTHKLDEMGLEYIDTLFIHWPVEKYLHKTWEALINLKEKGVARQIGICNLRLRHLEALKLQGIIPDTLQIERHPLNTFDKEVEWCHTNSVALQAYSPLCKMHQHIRENQALNAIARKYNKDLGQVILRWHIDTGATPVFTSKNLDRIRLYAHLSDFSLTKEEINTISACNCNHKLYLESLICPGF